MRVVWIEMAANMNDFEQRTGHNPLRVVWIEITHITFVTGKEGSQPFAGCVD